MAEIRSVVNVLVRFGVDLDELFVRAGSLLQHLDDTFLATIAVAVIDLARNELTYMAAGHPPMLLSNPDGTVVTLSDGRQPPIGMVFGSAPAPVVAFPEGASLVAYTDGLIERRGEDIDVSVKRIATAVANRGGMDARLVADLLIAEQIAGHLRTDDLALVVVRRSAPDAGGAGSAR
jgi:serine phosphatase RsbU (regulator of sigma subunit)